MCRWSCASIPLIRDGSVSGPEHEAESHARGCCTHPESGKWVTEGDIVRRPTAKGHDLWALSSVRVKSFGREVAAGS